MLASTPVGKQQRADRWEDHGMERFIAGLVKDFENGKLDRREFCQTVAIAAIVCGAGEAANAQAARGFKMIGINHISYSCPDYAKARDFYTAVLGMESTPGKDNGKRANLMFGPEPGKGGSFIVARTASADAKPSRAVVDHVCYTIADWDEQKVRGALKAKGLEVGGRAGSLHVFDPFGYYVQIASAEAENAFRR
jgi:catechol 2,3-dioxygenase-like lactoylglutathione lyase family enzyme